MKTVTCAWCGKEYQLKDHYLARKIREGKPTCCSNACGNRMSNFNKKKEVERIREDNNFQAWKRGFDEGYQQAILDGAT